MYNCEQFGLLANTLVLSNIVRLFKIPPLRSGELLPKKLRNIKRKSKGTHMRALSRGPAKTPFPHKGLYSNRHLPSCRLVFHFFYLPLLLVIGILTGASCPQIAHLTIFCPFLWLLLFSLLGRHHFQDDSESSVSTGDALRPDDLGS